MRKEFLIEILDIAEELFNLKFFVVIIYAMLMVIFLVVLITMGILLINSLFELFRIFKYLNVKDDQGESILSSYTPLVLMNFLSGVIMVITSYHLVSYTLAGMRDPSGIGFNVSVLIENTFYDKGLLFTLITALFIINTFQVDIIDIQDRLMPFVNYMFINDIKATSDKDPYELRYGEEVKTLKILPQKELDQRIMIKNLSFFLLGILFFIFAAEDVVSYIKSQTIQHDFISTAYFIFLIFMLNHLMDFQELSQLARSSQINMEVVLKHQISPSYTGKELQEKMNVYYKEMQDIEEEVMNEMFDIIDNHFFTKEKSEDLAVFEDDDDEIKDKNKEEQNEKEDED